MTSIAVTHATGHYDVLIAPGALDQAGRWLTPFARDGRLIVVTDSAVADAVLPRLVAGAAPLTIDPIIVPAGEGSKDWATLARVTDALIARGIERADAVVALGGGVIGDLTGFAAAIVKRGCRVVQIPTTLLAQVDSSVGGKTGINTTAGKNLVGAFHPPAFVLIDPTTLATLPERHRRAGYAEVVKYGLIDDEPFFGWCESNGAALIAGGTAQQAHAIAHSVAAKARIVAADEYETNGQRALLNLGHTFGHALEAATGYGDRLLHGEAVAAGCAIAFRYSAARGLCDPGDAARVTAHFARCGLPVDARTAGVTDDGATLADHMAHDKKKAGGTVPFLLARGIGQTFLDRTVDLASIAAFLDADARREPQPA